MKPKKGQELTVKIDRLVFGGEGIASIDGFKLFVPSTAPGDEALVEVRKVRSSYGEGKVLDLVKPSPLRIEARCKHADVCGGCKWQFLAYEEQLKIKEQQVKDSVHRLGGLSEDLVLPIIGNESPWFYRNKMELSFGHSAEPNLTIGGKVMLGFFPPGYHYEVFDVEECFLQSELVAELVKKVRDFANSKGVSVFNSHTGEGVLKSLIIREGKNTNEVMVILVTSADLFDKVEDFKALFAGDTRITSLYWNSVIQIPGQPTWTEEKLLAGKPTLTEALVLENGHRLEFDILPQAFFQTNTKQAQVLYSKVVELAELSGGEVVYDLYCGTGTIGLFCAHKAKQVIGIEVNESAVDSARSNAQKNGITNAHFYLGSVEERLKSLEMHPEYSKPDVLIVDPPRAGLGEKVVLDCTAFGAKKIVYVSCNPTTLARDLKQFAELGYRTVSVQPVDMFPQTHHVECVSLLVK